jgi:hypothetical protein
MTFIQINTNTPESDDKIEERIVMEIIVDCYDSCEQSMGWYCYLNDNMTFPFKAKTIKLASTSPLKLNDVIEVVGLDESKNCEYDMFVKLKLKDDEICVPLKQLAGIDVDKMTDQCINDWSYWNTHGYCF